MHLGIGPNQTTAFTAAATSNDYFPEWIHAGNGYIDLDFFARNFDTKQWAHAFGPVWFPPTVQGGIPDTHHHVVPVVLGQERRARTRRVSSRCSAASTTVSGRGPHLTAKTYNAGAARTSSRSEVRTPT